MRVQLKHVLDFLRVSLISPIRNQYTYQCNV
jgi:hypothetical protein